MKGVLCVLVVVWELSGLSQAQVPALKSLPVLNSLMGILTNQLESSSTLGKLPPPTMTFPFQ